MDSVIARSGHGAPFTSYSAQPEQPSTSNVRVPLTPELEKAASTISNGQSDSEGLRKGSPVLSGKVVTGSHEAPLGTSELEVMPCESGGSFETNDSALGESLSETEMRSQGAPSSPSALIVKFSTTNPGRINAVERRGSLSSHIRTPTANADPHCCLGSLKHDKKTPPSNEKKRRGRPPGSKNKNPSTRLGVRNGNAESQNQTPTRLYETGYEEYGQVPTKPAPKLSEIMKAIWAKRRGNGTDGLRGGRPTEKTILKREKKKSADGQSYDNLQRQLFKGQHAIRSMSGPSLPKLSPKLVTDAAGVQQAVQRDTVHTRSIRPGIPAKLASGASNPSELSTICQNDAAITRIFNTYIYPVLARSKARYTGSLPDKVLLSICKQVSHPFRK